MKTTINIISFLVLFITLLMVAIITILGSINKSSKEIDRRSKSISNLDVKEKVITLSRSLGVIDTPLLCTNTVNNGALSEFSNGLVDYNSNSIFIVGNDYPSVGDRPNPNIYLFKFTPPDTFVNYVTIDDFYSYTQQGNLYVEQDANYIYVLGRKITRTFGESYLMLSKIRKSDLKFDSSFKSFLNEEGKWFSRIYNLVPGGLLLDGDYIYAVGIKDYSGEIYIYKLKTIDSSSVEGFGEYGLARIDPDGNSKTKEVVTDILSDGNDLILVGEQRSSSKTSLMLFKVNPGSGELVPGSLITIEPLKGSFSAAPLDAVILNDKVYLGGSFQLSRKSVLAVFDLNDPKNKTYYTFKDKNNNDIKIEIRDVYYPGSGSIIYLSGKDKDNNAGCIVFDTLDNSGSYLIINPTPGNWWGNVFYNNNLYIFGVLNKAPSYFFVLPIKNP